MGLDVKVIKVIIFFKRDCFYININFTIYFLFIGLRCMQFLHLEFVFSSATFVY
jgi:hypothetical protein